MFSSTMCNDENLKKVGVCLHNIMKMNTRKVFNTEISKPAVFGCVFAEQHNTRKLLSASMLKCIYSVVAHVTQ